MFGAPVSSELRIMVTANQIVMEINDMISDMVHNAFGDISHQSR